MINTVNIKPNNPLTRNKIIWIAIWKILTWITIRKMCLFMPKYSQC